VSLVESSADGDRAEGAPRVAGAVAAEEAAVEPVAPAVEMRAPEPERGGLAWWKIAIVPLLLGGVVTFLLLGTGAQDAFVYSKLVDEVVARPAEWQGRELRVEGELTQGSIRFREQPCEWRFELQKNGRTMPVRFPQCIVPDTFRDGQGLTVVVQGRLDGSGAFEASQVVPRCPSKYEMQQRQQAGEAMPHGTEGLRPGVAVEGT
jgi:cytochrome c-type biogenesis protein CcmE